jgi:HK97 family phage major capsid protein
MIARKSLCEADLTRAACIADMPDVAAGSLFIAFGDFRRGLSDRGSPGVCVLRDPHSAKTYVLFYTTKWVGGGVQDFDAIKVMKSA